MKTLILFRAINDSGELCELVDHRPGRLDGSVGHIMSQMVGDAVSIELGYRPTLMERAAMADDGYYRSLSGDSDWMVADIQIRDDPSGRFDQIATCICEHSPLQDHERRWQSHRIPGLPHILLRDDKWWNLTKLASDHSRAIADFLRLKSTKGFMAVLERQLGRSPVEVSVGGNTPGSWGHPLVGAKCLAWLEPAYELRVYRSAMGLPEPEQSSAK